MRIAFKEWAIVVDALAAGQQILILRKGGISEGRRGFQVEHAEFLLLPTRVHQQREALIPSAQTRFDQVQAATKDEGVIPVEFFAHVVSWRRLESLETARRLSGQHIWGDDVIAQRFEWGKEKNIHALAVRVFRLPAITYLPSGPAYSGCKSWIDLEKEIATEGAVPVLSKEAFNEKLTAFHAALDEGGAVSEPPPGP